jgi:RNA polymerase sigma-70 factor (ECF subfamily)
VIAARQMRRILIDLARRRRFAASETEGRAGAPDNVTDDGWHLPADPLALDEALTRLEKISARACHAVELRFFAGLTEREAAEVLNISLATFKRDWAFAKSWLYGQLR